MINDAYGQEEGGDRLIVETAKLIRNISRPGGDIIARSGGGEFCFCCPIRTMVKRKN